ncbi:tRNA (guanine(37)-N1)-methyltransferase isoform X2 [Cylas formicarius]|uniref:tRNA (guanine(37)-N1)-methyltransferase isoform X2 n=1 Tax=Cylas formicarius TaxID=197179 RepID=UPI002958D5D1|nr:tRNA (guanine(37)-N1)-methyltransferase isoform X2 [Cylas formicarius]
MKKSPFITSFGRRISNHLSRAIIKGMPSILKPPVEVAGLKELDKQKFEKRIEVPVLNVRNLKVSSVLPHVKKHLLKLEKFKPVKDSLVFLNPELVNQWSDIPEEIRQNLEGHNLSENHLERREITLTYENYSAETVFRAVLPQDKEQTSSFTKVGHIVHVNLREHLLPYKKIIGQVLIDKISGCKSVVNKVNEIDSTYRNFQMEVLIGEPNMLTVVKENGCNFEFDFSKVYWNSRLSTEHERIVKMLSPGDIVFDLFAGVGPFAIPAAKNKCTVYANDLNPHSFQWLIHNKIKNKIDDSNLKAFNMDGRDFIRSVFKENLSKYVEHNNFVIMNLPALAVEFLDVFVGLFDQKELPPNFKAIKVFVYCFAKGENPLKIARDLVERNLSGHEVSQIILDIFKVRSVSSMKEMVRLTLQLTRDILVGNCVRKRQKEMDQRNSDSKKIHLDLCVLDQNGQKQEENQQRVQSCRSKGLETEGES